MENDNRLNALNKSEAALHEVEAKAFDKNKEPVLNLCKKTFKDWDQLRPEVKGRFLRNTMDQFIPYYVDFNGGLLVKFNETLKENEDLKEKLNRLADQVANLSK